MALITDESVLVTMDEFIEFNEYRSREPGLQEELIELRLIQVRMNALGRLLEGVATSLGISRFCDLGESEVDLSCSTCARVLCAIHACASIAA